MIKLAMLALIGGAAAMMLRRKREEDPAAAPAEGPAAGYDDVTNELRQMDDAGAGRRS